LTRRDISSFAGTEQFSLITQSIQELVDKSDVIVECTGDAIWAAEVVEQAFQAKLPVVTMNSEFQVVAGSYYREHGLLSESEGDQPGSLAVLNQEVRSMGFEPIVYGSQKSFLNADPDLAKMQYWAKHQNQSLKNTISFTDGTKVQIESALIANGLGAHILMQGLLGSSHRSTKKGALELANHAKKYDQVISDYVLNDQGHGEVFIVATHSGHQKMPLAYYKLGHGPFYYLEKPYHLGYLEIIKSIEKVFRYGTCVLNNGSNPSVGVAAVAKRTLLPGIFLEQGIGSFDVRGVAVNIQEQPNHVPISLLQNCEVQRLISTGEMLKLSDVALPETRASKAWQFTRDRALSKVMKKCTITQEA
jgi:predicted homoserine dehydrogenase-like protein